MKENKQNIGIYFLILMLLTQVGCTSKFDLPIKQDIHSLEVYKDSLTIKIGIIDQSIFHVEKYVTEKGPTSLPDYVTVLEPQDIAWEVQQKTEELTISTATSTIKIDTAGNVSFFDANNQKLVREFPKSSYLNTPDSGQYAVSQAFECGEEGLYGLGQFQSGRMNWKNVPVRLEQYNQEIVVPFLVSTNNYGIYWHNYSITDFNYPDNNISFSETIDSVKNIRKVNFKAEKSGVYNFYVESPNPKKLRFNGPVRVIIDSDTVLNHATVFVPNCLSGAYEMTAGSTYEIVFQNTKSQVIGNLKYNEPDLDKTTFSSLRGQSVDYYLIGGENPETIVSEYQKLTGNPSLFTKSAYGFWQCRERYHNQGELLDNAFEYRKRQIPIDNIVQDWYYWPEGAKGPEWDRNKYPDPKAMIDILDSLNLQLMVSVWPEVENNPLLEKYDLLDYKLAKTNNLDFYDAGVQDRYYKMLSDSMFHFGVTSIWLDGTEPERKPLDTTKTAVGEYAEVSNSYSLLVNKAVYEGKMKEYPNKRVFNLTRSAYAGQQRYGAASWSGDVMGTWEQFSEQIPAGLNFSMTGIPNWTTDIGGFFREKKFFNPTFDDQYTNEEFKALLTRWFQFGAFNPIFRIHGFRSETEIWRYGAEFEQNARKFINLRYKLLPYLYSEAYQVSTQGGLLMSPVVYHYPEDQNTWGIADQFFFGKSFLVCPVTEYNVAQREVYLPAGEWFDYWTDEKIDGGRTINARTPLDELPLFVKAGTIIPTGPEVQFSTQKTDEPFQLIIYPGKDAQFDFYLDDYETNDYQNGTYNMISLMYNDKEQQLTIGKTEGSYMDFEKEPLNLEIQVKGSSIKKKIEYKGEQQMLNLK